MFKPILLSLAVLSSSALAAGQGDKLERGKYLTEEIGKCQDCHTPRGEKGELDRAKWLRGTVLDFQPINPVPGWHKTSPDLTPGSGLWERWGDAGLVKFLVTALDPRGNAADPPMPAYKMK